MASPSCTGATFGYIIGFIVAAFLVGSAVDTRVRFWTYPYLTLVAALAIIYALGVIWFYVGWMNWSDLVDVQGLLSVTQLMWMMVPFIPLDLVKVALVAAVGASFCPAAPTPTRWTRPPLPRG